jgi:hypothetical protein
MSSSLVLITGQQYTPHATLVATQQAYDTVAAMAATNGGGGGGGQILAQTGSSGPIMTSDRASFGEPAHIANLRAAANKACFIDRDPQQCSYWSQAYASADIGRSYPGGDIFKFNEDAKREGSLWKWFSNPTWTAPTKTTTKPVSSVAIVMTNTKATAPQ